MELKLGKLPAVIDKRTIPLKAILRKELLPELPTIYDLDEVLGVEDNFMYGNDQYGDCVIAARGHHTLRFEAFEQGWQIPITDQEVVDEYFKESGGADSGLYLLNSLKAWRNDGWLIGGKAYTIYAFASVDWKDHDEVKHCIHLLGGVNFGMKVYERDMEQFKAGEVWDIMPYSGNLLGGHGVYLHAYAYDEYGITCMTWGKRQRLTWAFWDDRVDEAYGIVDNKDDWVGDSPIDVVKLDAFLDEITEGRGEGNPGCSFWPVAILWKIKKRLSS
jgi:hypothetical protein